MTGAVSTQRSKIVGVLLTLIILVSSGAARAQTSQVQDPERPSLLANIAVAVATDPTTYAPAAMPYDAMHLH